MAQLRNSKRREAILDVAAPAFLELGYAGVTMSSIAEKSGGSKATLWRHFRSKAELFEAVLERETVSFRNSIHLSLISENEFEKSLRKFCYTFTTMITQPEFVTLIRLVTGEVGRFPEIAPIFLARGPELINAELAGFIKQGMDSGVLINQDADNAAKYLTAMCLAGSHQKLLFGLEDQINEADLRHEADTVADVFMRAYTV